MDWVYSGTTIRRRFIRRRSFREMSTRLSSPSLQVLKEFSHQERSKTAFDMFYHAFTFALAGAWVIGASPVSNSDGRKVVNCTDPAAAFSTSCWSTLDLSDYLGRAGTGWIYSTPQCKNTRTGTGDDRSGCCISGELWSTCFVRLASGVSGADCNAISPHRCSWNGQGTDASKLKSRKI